MIIDTELFAAPLQGFTDCVWREAHAMTFGDIDAYVAPFMRVEHGEPRRRDLADIDPEHCSRHTVIPQILACRPLDAVLMAERLKVLRYSRVDINLGCPFKPIALKGINGQGCGMLRHPEAVRQLFTALAAVDCMSYSVKMRLGWDDASQWRDILPLMELLRPTHITVHPRIGLQQYGGELLTEQFGALLAASPYPINYNGDLTELQHIDDTLRRFPELAGVMIGRGLVAHPHMLCPDRADRLLDFHQMLFDGYRERLTGGDHQLLRRMQALWEYFLPDAGHRLRKAIKKANSLAHYEQAAQDCITDYISKF